MRLSWCTFALALAATACSSKGSERLDQDSGIQPRVFDPPASRVRAVPPHHVHARGIGPYELGASLKEILGTLPHGPRIELFRLGRLADFSLAKSENGALLVGIERGLGVTFVAALAEKIVRTEKGVGVGSPATAAVDELGPVLLSSNVASDPRLRRHRDLPGVIFLSGLRSRRAPRVNAIVVDRASVTATKLKKDKALPGGEATPVATSEPCVIDDALTAQARKVAKLGGPIEVSFLCRGGVVTGAVAYGARRVVYLTLEPERDDKGGKSKNVKGTETRTGEGPARKPAPKFRRAGSASTGNIAFAAPIELPEGGVHVAVVNSERGVRELRVTLQVFRVEASRLVMVATRRVYSLSKNEITWVGGTLAGVGVAVEVAVSGPTTLRVNGLYYEARGDRIAMVAPLAEQSVNLKRKTAAARKEELDAGPGNIDAGDGKKASDAGTGDAKKPRPPATRLR